VNALNSTWPLAPAVAHAQPSSPDFALLDSLPCRSVLELDADKTAPRTARRWLSALLREWSLAQFEESATLIASELVTNSVAEIDKVTWPAERPPVRLSLHAGPSVVVVTTWDPVVVAPAPREAADDEESGWGLFIVAEYSAGWGFYYPADIGGKATWAVIKIP
jgi:hypothetical protein